MKAAVRERYGTPDVVELRDIDRPDARRRPGAGPRPSRVRQPGRPRRPDAAPAVRPHSSWGCARRGTIGSGSMSPASSRPSGPASTRFKAGDEVFADLFAVRPGRLRRVRLRSRAGVPVDAGRDDVRGGGHAPALGDPRAPGAPAPQRPDDPAGRQGPDRRRVGQCRPVRRPDREVDGRGGDRRLQHRQGRLRAFARRRPRARLHRRSTTRRPASATTGSSTPTRTTRSCASGARSRPNGVYVTLGGTSRADLRGPRRSGRWSRSPAASRWA